MVTMYATPSGGDKEGAHAILFYAAHRDSIEAKSVAGRPAGVSANQMSIFARIEVSAPPADRSSGVLPGTYDEVGVAIALYIARDRRARTESLACGFTRQSKKPVAIFSG